MFKSNLKKKKKIEFPNSIFGSHEALGLDNNVCSDRYGRYGPYGYYGATVDVVPGYEKPTVDFWNDQDWEYLQKSCLKRNSNRYWLENGHELGPVQSLPGVFPPPPTTQRQASYRPQVNENDSLKYSSRSAVIIRGFSDMKWSPNSIIYLRSLIMELSLHSGGEYEVFLLVHVTDNNIRLQTEDDIEALRQALIPPEFRRMTIFFNERMLHNWYRGIDEHKYSPSTPCRSCDIGQVLLTQS